MTNEETDERRGWTSASNAEADSRCPGRHMAQKTLGKNFAEERSDDADFGDQVHAALKDGSEPTDKKVLFTVERMREIDIDLLIAFFGDNADKVRAIRERRLWTKFVHKNWELQHSGQVDVIYIHAGRALIVEYKSLAGDLASSPTNLQLRDQVVLTRGNVMVPEIGTAVNQPLVEGIPKIAVYKKEHIDRAEMEMQKRIITSNTPGQDRIPGDLQCKFCRARFNCPEYAKWSSALTPKNDIGDIPVERWTPAMMVRFLENKSAARRWIDECEQQIKKVLRENPDTLPGWELKSEGGRTTITDMTALWNRLLEAGLTNEDLIAACSIKMENLETLVRVATKAKGQALAKEKKKLLDGVSAYKADQPSIVPKEES